MNIKNLGGRSLDDIIQYYYSVRSEIKDTFDINKVPKEIEQQLENAEELTNNLTVCYENLEDMIVSELIKIARE